MLLCLGLVLWAGRLSKLRDTIRLHWEGVANRPRYTLIHVHKRTL